MIALGVPRGAFLQRPGRERVAQADWFRAGSSCSLTGGYYKPAPRRDRPRGEPVERTPCEAIHLAAFVELDAAD